MKLITVFVVVALSQPLAVPTEDCPPFREYVNPCDIHPYIGEPEFEDEPRLEEYTEEEINDALDPEAGC